MELVRTTCCGVRDYNGLQELRNPVDILKDLFKRFNSLGEYRDQGFTSGAFVLFTCPTADRIIPRLATFITENGLGTVTQAPSTANPNSGRNLEAMLFGVNHDAYSRWYMALIDAEVQAQEAARRTAGELRIGDRVTNIARNARRNGQEATVVSVDEDNIEVTYADGSRGEGETRHYQLIAA